MNEHILTLIDKNERSGRSYTFHFNSRNDRDEVLMLSMEYPENITSLISTIKKNKMLYDKLEYKILGIDNAVDIVTIIKTDSGFKIPIIDRLYEPLGYALPGGFIEKGDTPLETAIKEFNEELSYEIDVNPIFITKEYSGRDKNGELYDKRGEVTTQGFVFLINNHNLVAGDDAKSFKYLEFDEGLSLKEILSQLEKEDFAMTRHQEILKEALENTFEIINSLQLEKSNELINDRSIDI